MIASLRGILVEKSYDRVIVEVGGVGYSALVSLQTLAELPALDQPVKLRTYLQVREDAHVLYGFGTEEERRAFEQCISVSGVGPKMAMALLSALRPGDLAVAIRKGDVTRLSKTPGIGKKTAERLVVELRDRIDKAGLGPAGTAERAAEGDRPRTDTLETLARTAASALTNLGYREADAERAATEVLARIHKEGGTTPPLETLLREALRNLTA